MLTAVTDSFISNQNISTETEVNGSVLYHIVGLYTRTLDPDLGVVTGERPPDRQQEALESP